MKTPSIIKKYFMPFILCLVLGFSPFFCEGQIKIGLMLDTLRVKTQYIVAANAPKAITRNIIQDKAGNIWFATFEGIFRYNGKTFSNITSAVSSARFFSILEDSQGNFWFGSIGSGLYYYDGKSFRNFTTKDGLLNNEVGCIYEDKSGNIWLGVNGGTSRYDGRTFRNYLMKGDAIGESDTGEIYPNLTRPTHEINSIIEDNTGKIWLGTRDHSFVYDGKTFTTLRHNHIPFKNIRCIIEDRKGYIWLGGSSGLWRYKNGVFTNITQNFVGYIYEDKNGNIWTSSERTLDRNWVFSRYDANTLYNDAPIIQEIIAEHEGNRGMGFGILQANDGNIWFGKLDGTYRYNGNTLTGFKEK